MGDFKTDDNKTTIVKMWETNLLSFSCVWKRYESLIIFITKNHAPFNKHNLNGINWSLIGFVTPGYERNTLLQTFLYLFLISSYKPLFNCFIFSTGPKQPNLV